MTFTLGMAPLSMQVQLSRDSDFDAVLTNTDGSWAVGESLKIVFNDATGPTTWTASMAGADATFYVDKTAVNTLIDDAPSYATLIFVSGSTDARWGQGGVTING